MADRRRLQQQLQPPRDPTKFPTTQLLFLSLVRIAEPIALTSIFPYAWRLVLHFNVGSREHASFYAGLLISAFALAESITGMFWDALSDRIGRKPVLLIGCLGTTVSLLVVGFAPNFWVALFGRFLGGALNGNIGVIQTMVGELVVNPKHEPKAYAVMPFVWSVGTILGPSIGGFFASPADSWPGIFPQHGIFDRFPYLLPNLICIALMVVSVLAGYFYLVETHPDLRPWSIAQDEEEADAETPILPIHAGNTSPAAALAQESYGTFKAISEEDEDSDIEDWILRPDGTSRPSSVHKGDGKKVFTKQVIMITVALGLFTYHTMTYDHLLPIYFQDDRAASTSDVGNRASFAGGLGLGIKDVGVIMSFDGFIALFVQALIFPLVCSWLGVSKTFILVSLGHPLTYLIIPYLTFLPEHLLYPGIYVCLAIRNLFTITAYPLILILLKEASPSPSVLGQVNGLAASTAAASRTVASPVAGYLYGLGIQMQFTAIAWWASALVAVVGAIQVFWISRDKDRQRAEGFLVSNLGFQETEVVKFKAHDMTDSGYASADEETPFVRRSEWWD